MPRQLYERSTFYWRFLKTTSGFLFVMLCILSICAPTGRARDHTHETLTRINTHTHSPWPPWSDSIISRLLQTRQTVSSALQHSAFLKRLGALSMFAFLSVINGFNLPGYIFAIGGGSQTLGARWIQRARPRWIASRHTHSISGQPGEGGPLVEPMLQWAQRGIRRHNSAKTTRVVNLYMETAASPQRQSPTWKIIYGGPRPCWWVLA